MPTWLNSQKKADLARLAQTAGLGNLAELEELRKDQLVIALEGKLNPNPPDLVGHPDFAGYYARRKESPVKREPRESATSTATAPHNADSGTKSTVRKQRRVAEIANGTDLDEPMSSPTVALPRRIPSMSRTPARIRDEITEAIPLPPSPAAITEMIERESARISAKADELYDSSHVYEFVNRIRIELSSMVGVHMIMLTIEAISLHRVLVPWVYKFDTPAVPVISLSAYPIYLPDLFAMLTGVYWSTTTLWSALSFWIPLVTAWFINLSLKLKNKGGVETWKPKYRVDPLIFNISKALFYYLVFTEGARLAGLFADETVVRLAHSLPIGYKGALMSAFAGIAFSMWDAVQGKKGWL